MIGTTVDRYKIVEELGHGGMSVVYRGVDTSLERDVAVKVLHNHLARKLENRKRFHREAKAIARLKHPNILSVFDFSSEDAERSYIVMEFVDGLNLREFLTVHGPPPPEMVALIGAEICKALSNAHDHGIIHRDLKPENIMVSGAGELKLMDFGIAHVIDAETMTQTGSLLGSPAHMAPELIEGEKVGPRVDIFALGTVLYWLATGELPFDGTNAPQVLKRVLEGTYVEAEDLDGRVGHELSGIISRCMSHQPEDRYATVREARDALLEFCEECETLDAPELELRRYLTTPERWSEAFLDDIEERLLTRARRELGRKNVALATRLFNRILAYDPENPEVLKHLSALHRREWATRAVGIAVAVVLAVIAVVYFFDAKPAAPRVDDGPSDLAAVEDGSREAESITALSVQAAAQSALETQAIETGASVAESAVSVTMAVDNRSTVMVTPALIKTPTFVRPAAEETDMGREEADMDAPSWLYKFHLVPAAAELNIDGRTIGSFEALKGIELEEGRYHLTARSRGCKPWRELLVVDGPQQRRMPVVLEWEKGVVKVLSDVDSVVYLGDQTTDIARRLSARKPATFQFDFGDADQKSIKRVVFRIAPANDMTKVERHRVVVRPGNVENLNVSFR